MPRMYYLGANEPHVINAAKVAENIHEDAEGVALAAQPEPAPLLDDAPTIKGGRVIVFARAADAADPYANVTAKEGAELLGKSPDLYVWAPGHTPATK